jgi:phosphatidylserine synthase
VPYYSFKDIHWHSRQPFWLLIAVIVLLKFVIAQPQVALFSSITLYLISGLIWWVLRRTRRLRRPGPAVAAGRSSGVSSSS